MQFSKPNLLLFFIATLFSLPDTNIYGISSANYLIIVLIAAIVILRKRFELRLYLKFNAPFIYLIIISLLSFIIKYFNYSDEDMYYVVNHNKELILDLLLSFFIYAYTISSNNQRNYLTKFIGTYFTLNALYLVMSYVSPESRLYFHQSLGLVY